MQDKQHTDDLPSQPVHTNDAQKVVSAPSSPQAPTAQTSTYESNPFAITFNNFTKMFKHAKAVAIVMVVFGALGSFGNTPNFNTSDFEDFNTDDFSFIGTESDVLGENTVAQNSDVQQELENNISLTASDDPETLDSEGNLSDAGVAVAGIILFVSVILLVIFSIALLIGALWNGLVAAAANMAVRDRDISFGDAFSQSTSRFGAMFVATFISSLKILGGYLLFIVPGVRAQARYAALPYVVMGNPSMSGKQAVDETKKLYEGHLLEAFSISWIAGVIPFVGSILGAVGLAQSSRQISEYKSKGQPKPKMSRWNWLPIILVAGILLLLFIAVMVVVLIAASSL